MPVRLLLLAAILFGACQSMPARTDTDLDRLQGLWQGGGPGGGVSVHIVGNRLRYEQSPSEIHPEFWYETVFTLPEVEGPGQIHAKIVRNATPDQAHVGKTVVAIYELEGDALTLGVVDDFEAAPPETLVGDWDWVADVFELERADCRGGEPCP